MITRLMPVVGIVAFILVGLVWRSWLQYRRFGHSGMMLFRSGRAAQHVREGAMVLTTILVAGQTIVYAVDPARLAPLALLPCPTGGVWWGLGALLLFGGTVLMVAAQLHLGASWRVGVEEGARPGLVTTGLYRVCRNPIFLAMFLVLGGLTVLLPTWPSAILAAGTVIGIRIQVREEEGYLQRTYGDSYAAYARRVGRFLPGVGTLSVR